MVRLAQHYQSTDESFADIDRTFVEEMVAKETAKYLEKAGGDSREVI